MLSAVRRYRHTFLIDLGRVRLGTTHKINGCCQFLAKVIAALGKCAVVGNLIQAHNNGLTKCRCADNLAHGIGRSLEDLAYKCVLDKFLACCRQSIASAKLW